MTRIKEPERFVNALKLAREIGGETRNSFRDCLTTLNRIKRNYQHNGGVKTTLVLENDFVKHSFIFSYEQEGAQVGLWGGFILHGFQETWSVELVAKAYPHWSIHT